MPTKQVNSAPVDQVGGTQNRGPWSKDLEDIAVDDRLTRPVGLDDGSVQDVEVTITDIQQILRDDGTETDGYAVSYQFDDPTNGGTL